jgi:predicted ATPase/DNA-binding CsgD family transcriptional regulator
LLSDIDRSAWEADPEAMRRAVKQHHKIVDDAVARHAGVRPAEQGEGEGEGIVAVFSRASDALEAALEAQRRLAAQARPDGSALSVRIALDTADARPGDEGNYFGVALSRCVRIKAAARGGQTLLSRATHDLVADRLPAGVTLLDCGTHRLRDLRRPEQIFALEHPDIPARAGPLRSVDPLPNNLPSQLTSFVGRERELAELRAALASTRLLTLTGAGGCGKTRLALQLAADRLDGYPDGVWWVELAPLTDPELIGNALVGALAVRVLPGATPLQSVCAALASRSALVVLDNCEHLLEASAHAAVTLLDAAPQVQVLATSRAPLGVGGESAWRVPAMSLPAGPDSAPVDALVQSDAVQLFFQRAAKVRANFTITNDNAAAVARICADLDGIPLAIELAAARIPVLSVQQVSAGLADRFHLLTSGTRSALPRQQTLRASVDWSHELLSPEERAVLRRLGAFAGGWTLEMAEEVGADQRIERYAILDLVTALVDKSLVLAEERGPAVRYGMLETIRHYSAERLAESGERDRIRDRHLDVMLALAERAAPELETSRQPSWLPILDLEAANLAAAFEWALETDTPLALRLGIALTFYWKVRARQNVGARSLGAAIDKAGEHNPELRCRAMWARAYLLQFSSAPKGVAVAARAAAELAEEIGDPATIARSLALLGALYRWRDPAAARPGLERSVELARETGDEWCLAFATQELSGSYLLQSRDDDALEAVAWDAAMLDGAQTELVIRRRYCHAWVHMNRAELSDYWSVAERALQATRDLGDTTLEGMLLQMAAFVDMYEGRPQLAIEKLEPMLRRYLESGVGFALPFILMSLAQAESQVGQLEAARARLEALIESGLDGGYILSYALGVLANVLRLLRDPRADACVAQGLEVARPLDSPAALWGQALAGARLELDRGNWTAAERMLHEPLSLASERTVWLQFPDLLDGIAEVAGGLRSHKEAARLIGAIDVARERLGLPVFATERPRRETLIAHLRDALGADTYERAHAAGSTMDLEETVAYVRRARGARKRPPGGWESLTPTELRVVELASEGLTNAAIAERMFISAATVKVHLAHVYGKLDVPNRAALATVAAKHARMA